MIEIQEKRLSYRSDKLERLRDPQEAVGYLKACLDETDMPELFLAGLKDVAEAEGIGMSQLSRDTNLNREGLYKILSKRGNPELGSLTAILDALGMKLSVELKNTS